MLGEPRPDHRDVHMSKPSRPWYTVLYIQVLIAIAAGVSTETLRTRNPVLVKGVGLAVETGRPYFDPTFDYKKMRQLDRIGVDEE